MNFWYKVLKTLLKLKRFFVFFIFVNIGFSFLEIHLYVTIANIASGSETPKLAYVLLPLVYFISSILCYEFLYAYVTRLTKSDFEDTWRLSERVYLNRNIEWQLTTITKYLTNYI